MDKTAPICCKARKGIVLSHIIGKYYLIADRSAWKYCSEIREVNEAAADVWKLVCEGLSAEEMRKSIAGKYNITEEEAGEGISLFISKLEELGYLERVNEKTD